MTTPFQVCADDPIERVKIALEELRAGRMVILTDDEDRENEGDLVLAAERVTPERINFMATHARGLICLSLTREQVDRLDIPMMVTNNQSAYETAFTVSIEARHGVSTGISAADRAHTIATAIRPDATRRDLVTPGHVFPLRARPGGVLERIGQTEGSVDLAKLAGLDPSAVICEIMNADGTMSRVPDLLKFGATHHIHMCSVADIIKYRLQNERVIEAAGDGTMDIEGLGRFHTRLYRGNVENSLHMALWRGALDGTPTLARVQAAPPAWSGLGGSRSLLARTARSALQQIAGAGRGALILMHLDGSSRDNLEQAWLQDFRGVVAEPVSTSAQTLRDLGAGCQILRDLGLAQLRLMSSGAHALIGIEAYGLSVTERVAFPPSVTHPE